MATPPPVSIPPPYVPAPYLTKSLPAAQLVSQFHDFYLSIEYISTAPVLVFERLVANLIDALAPALEGRYHNEDKVVALDHKWLKAELTEARAQAGLHELVTGSHSRGWQKIGDRFAVTRKKPNIGTFHTYELLVEHRKKAPKEIYFSNPYSAPPGIIVGLRVLDIGYKDSIFMTSYPSNIQKDSFKINIDNLHSARVSAGCSWLEVDPNDPDFQFGTFSTQEDHPIDRQQLITTRRITFPRAYAEPPQIVVWLSTFYMHRQFNWRIKTYASDITSTGFTLHIESWGDKVVLRTATASWVSCTAGKSNVCTGTFGTLGSNSRCVTFESGNFTSPPRVLVAVNSFDMDCSKPMKLRVNVLDIGVGGMTWDIDTWDDSILHSAGASFIALG